MENENAGGGESPGSLLLSHDATHTGFKLRSVLSVLFNKLPPGMKSHVAFRHFFSDELDTASHALCVKFYTLFVLYFCSVFRLEGRRQQYVQTRTEKSGREFAAAHRRASTVLRELTTVYGTVLLRYNTHSEIHYTARHQFLLRGRKGTGPYSAGLKHPGSLAVHEKAFRYESEDFLFHEHVSSFAIQIIKLAFDGDAGLQQLAALETDKIFRSRAFAFGSQRRNEAVKGLARLLDSRSPSLRDNTAQMAELLVPKEDRIIVRYAKAQRTPFIQTRYPGGTSFMKYQRPRTSIHETPPPGEVEKVYTVEYRHAPFPAGHPAMSNLELFERKKALQKEQRGELQKAKKAAAVRTTGLTPEPFAPPPILPARIAIDTAAACRIGSNAPFHGSGAGTPLAGTMRNQSPPDSAGGSGGRTSPLVPRDGVELPSFASTLAASTRLNASMQLAGGSTTGGGLPPLRASAVGQPDDSLAATRLRVHTPSHPHPNNKHLAASVRSPFDSTVGSSALAADALARTMQLTPGASSRQQDLEELREREAAFHAAFHAPDQVNTWLGYDLSAEITSVYQAIANGVRVTSLGLPPDIMLQYDDSGILLISPKDGSPLFVY